MPYILHFLPLVVTVNSISTVTEYEDIDATAIIEPFLRPFSQMYDLVQQNGKAREYAVQVQQRTNDSPLSRSKGLFHLLKLLQDTSTTTTTTQSPLRQLLATYIDPLERGAKMINEEMQELGLVPTSTTTTTSRPTTTPSLINESFKMLFQSSTDQDGNDQGALVPSLLQIFTQPLTESFRSKRQAIFPPSSPIDIFDKLLGFEQPVITSNPFTPNPLVSFFTTLKPFSVPTVEPTTPSPMGLPRILKPLPEPTFHLQDPFYNPLTPNRKNKLWQLFKDTLPDFKTPGR